MKKDIPELFEVLLWSNVSPITALNMMKSREKTYIGFIWCPVAVEVLIRQELQEFQTTEF